MTDAQFFKSSQQESRKLLKGAAWMRLFGRRTEAKRCHHPPKEVRQKVGESVPSWYGFFFSLESEWKHIMAKNTQEETPGLTEGTNRRIPQSPRVHLSLIRILYKQRL